ncbi:MAG: roadblock/LC7 domain-containing protein [Anaerolineae bacterium]|nr:roadblock/LC7 domain-containing protein [Anaerolineae bacterium]
MSNPHYQGVHNLQNGLTILPVQDEAIDQILAELVATVPAHFVLLTDSSGQVISFGGDRGQIDLVALGALVTGEQIASQEMARLAGEYQVCQMLIREGTRSNFYICDAGQYLVLLVKASNDIPIGWARMMIRHAGKQLERVIAGEIGEQRNSTAEMPSVPDADDDLLISFSGAVQELEQLIDDAVSQMEA